MTEELRDKARTLGLDRLTDEHLKQFERATTGMERHLQRLPRGMLTAQEPAHVYRAKGDTPLAAMSPIWGSLRPPSLSARRNCHRSNM